MAHSLLCAEGRVSEVHCISGIIALDLVEGSDQKLKKKVSRAWKRERNSSSWEDSKKEERQPPRFIRKSEKEELPK